MRNILSGEWKRMLAELANPIARLVDPHAEVDVAGDTLSVDAGACSGTLRLDLTRDRGPDALCYGKPNALVTAGSALSGALSSVESGLLEYRSVVDAMHICASRTATIRVWWGECQCDQCAGEGRSRLGLNGKCQPCNGTGTRKEDDPPVEV